MILFGEHAVVSGSTALGSAIDLRARVSVDDLPGATQVNVRNLGLIIEGFSVDLTSGQIASTGSSNDAMLATRYIAAVLKELSVEDIAVRVESDIPPAAGLGSSAAITVATLAALNWHLDLGLSREEVAIRSHRIEKAVQQGLGSPMDTALSALGGYQLVSDKAGPIELPEMEVVVGYTQKPHDTKSEVQKVQSLRASYPDIVDPIFKSIGSISSRAVILIKENRLEELGPLMNINHGLLEAIGVGTRELSELVYAARGAGEACGAKLTGAGGGGCIIALPGTVGPNPIITAIKQAKGQAFCVRTGGQGVRLER